MMKKESDAWSDSNGLLSRIVLSVKSIFGIECENSIKETTRRKNVRNDFKVTIYDSSYSGLIEIFEEYDGVQSDEGLGRELLRAATQGDIKKVKKLLENGVSPNIADEFGNTAILEAARKDHAELYRLLLKYNADQKVINKFGYSTITHVQNNADLGKFEIFIDFLRDQSNDKTPIQPKDIESKKIDEQRDNHSIGM